jgi:hypothetical protein
MFGHPNPKADAYINSRTEQQQAWVNLNAGQTPEPFTGKDFVKIAQWFRSGQQGGFFTTYGEALSRADLENCRKMALGFEPEFRAALAQYNERNPGQ